MLSSRYSKKIFSIILTLILILTIFSTITIAEEEKTDQNHLECNIQKYQSTRINNIYLDDTSTKITFKNLIQNLGKIRDGISPFFIVTKLNENEEKRTKIRLLLPTSIDIDGDRDFDIRVWSFRLPAIDFRPPALAIKTYLIVRRLPGMKDIKDDAFEIYLEYKPIITQITGEIIDYIRLGYQSPMGEEIPRTCIITHKTVPNLIYPRQKTEHKIAINPLLTAGKAQLNLLFSIAEPGNETNNDTFELRIQVNHTPAVKNEIVFNRYKKKFLSMAQTLDITRKDINSDVSIIIKQLMKNNASLTIDNIPKKLTLSWLFAKSGYIELDTHKNDIGRVELIIDDIIMLGFIPINGIYARIGWQDLGIKSITQTKPFNIFFDAHVSIEILDFYVRKPKLKPFGLLPFNLDINAAYISLDLGVDVDVGNLTIAFTYDSVTAKVKDINVEIEELAINLEDGENTDNESGKKVERIKKFLIYFGSILLSNGSLTINLDNANLVNSGEIDGFLHIADCSLTIIESIAIYIGNETVALTTKTDTSGSLSSFEAAGSFYLALSTQAQSTTFLAEIEGYMSLTNLKLEGINNSIEINLFNMSGNSTISTQPFPENALTYFGLKYESDRGFVEIGGVTASGGGGLDLLDMLDCIYLSGYGDIKAEIWKDSDQEDFHLYIESQKGLTLDLFKITFDHGLKFEIARSGTIQGHIGTGNIHAAFNIDGDGDGYVFLDAPEIDFEDVLLTYWRSGIITTGLRFSPSIRYIDADLFLLQWDSITLTSQNITIPYNWYLTGKISMGMNIDIFTGNQWYDLWPLEEVGSGGLGEETTYQMLPAGAGNSPNKPIKPIGPPGNPIVGRVVKGHSYSYTTITVDPDEDPVCYQWDWGDGTYSEWSVIISSDVGVTGSHIWTNTGVYNVRVKAKDINGEESEWSDPLQVIVRNPINNQQSSSNQNDIIQENQNNNEQNI